MSQLSTQGLDQNLVFLSILKFSHTTSPYGTKSYIWNHVTSRGNLELDIRNVRYIDAHGDDRTKVIMRASAGMEELEIQNLSELVRFCNLFDPSTGVEHPVEIATRSPLIAMRYPKTANTVKRLQIKFRSHEDFQKVLTILQDLRLPITRRETTAPAAGIPPTPSPALSMAESTASSSTLARPSSAIDPPNIQKAALLISPTKHEPDFKTPARPESSMSQDRSAFDKPQTSHSRSFQPPIDAPNHAISHVNSVQGPVSQSFILQEEPESRHMSYPSQIPTHFKPEMPRTSLYVDQLHSLQQSQKSIQSIASSGPSEIQLSSSAPLQSAPVMDSRDPTVPHSDPDRPASVPSLSKAEIYPFLARSTSSLPLPPKRELPFAVRSEPKKTKQLVPIPSKPSKAAPILPPSKIADAADDHSVTPTPKAPPKKRVAQRKAAVKSGENIATSDRLSMSDHILAEPETPPEEPSPLAAKSAAALGRPTSAPLGMVSKVAPPTKRTATPRIPLAKPKMINQAIQTEDLQPPLNFTSASTSTTPPQDYHQAIDKFVAQHGSRPSPPPFELYDTPGWAQLGDEDRARLVDNFICESLDDPDFLKLCEDVDRAWRRIGLNL